MDWWVQTEALNALMACYGYTQDEKYLNLAMKLWMFIQEYFRDRALGEWFTRLDEQAKADKTAEKIGPWRGPYHIVRSCIKLTEFYNDACAGNNKSNKIKDYSF